MMLKLPFNYASLSDIEKEQLLNTEKLLFNVAANRAYFLFKPALNIAL